MESVIARLLSEFESGKLSRRQFVQTLAMIAVASPVSGAVAKGSATAPTPMSSAAPWKTVWLDHISFEVSDYKRSVDFYTNLMGWHVKEDTGTQATLDINGIGGIIIRNRHRRRLRDGSARAGAPPSGALVAPGPAARRPITGVIDHISWGVEPWDTDTVKAELEKRHLQPLPDMNGPDFKSFHVTDPDGWDLQISNQTKERHG
jgi:catechol 2,3-dioxygenase-like lactoylglutathione lyase family enzyme